MKSSANPGWKVWEMAVAGLLAMAIAAGATTAALAGLAGLLFADGWVGLSLSETTDVLLQLPDHLDDPRRAFAPARQSQLPGPPGFYVSATLLAVPVAAAGLAVAAVRRRSSPPRGLGASWARRKDLTALVIREPVSGRLILGRRDGRLVAAEPRQSLIVVGPTQTGKTTGLAIPAILEWDGPVLATSVKTDLVNDSVAVRCRRGEVKIFDPTAVTGLERAHWTPLAGCATWQGARETAVRLCSVGQAGRGVTDSDYWTAAAARYLAPLLFAAASGVATMLDVVRWIDTDDRDEVRQTLAPIAVSGNPEWASSGKAALAALEAVWEADERLRSSLASTAGVALDAYGDPAVAESSIRADITPEWLLSGANTAYLCATATGQERLRPLLVSLIDDVISAVYRRAASTGRPIDPPLLVVLDEAANIAPLPRLDQFAATGAGQGLQLVTVVQDLAQIETRWGRKADTILNNHRAKLFGPGIACEKTLSYLNRVLGDEAVTLRSVTRGGGSERRSTTESTSFRPLAPADRTRQGRVGDAVLLYGSLPPAQIELRPWFADRDLRRIGEAATR